MALDVPEFLASDRPLSPDARLIAGAISRFHCESSLISFLEALSTYSPQTFLGAHDSLSASHKKGGARGKEVLGIVAVEMSPFELRTNYLGIFGTSSEKTSVLLSLLN